MKMSIILRLAFLSLLLFPAISIAESNSEEQGKDIPMIQVPSVTSSEDLNEKERKENEQSKLDAPEIATTGSPIPNVLPQKVGTEEEQANKSPGNKRAGTIEGKRGGVEKRNEQSIQIPQPSRVQPQTPINYRGYVSSSIQTSAGLLKDASEQGPILPEVTTPVYVSASDVNRISCQSPIQDLMFSSEKGLEGKFNGTSAFIKFKVEKRGNEKTYMTEPVEIYVICDSTVYTLIAHPNPEIRATTLRLQPSRKKDIAITRSLFSGMPTTKKILKLVKESYRGEYPDQYSVVSKNEIIDVAPWLWVKEVNKIDVPGEGLFLLEYKVRGVFSPDRQIIKIRETDFLKVNVAPNILGVSIVDHNLKPGDETRAFVVCHKGGRL